MPDNQETADEPLKLEVGMKVYENGHGVGAIRQVTTTSASITWDNTHATGWYFMYLVTGMRQAYLDREELAELRKFKDTTLPHLRAHMTCESCSAQDAEAIRKVLDEEAE